MPIMHCGKANNAVGSTLDQLPPMTDRERVPVLSIGGSNVMF